MCGEGIGCFKNYEISDNDLSNLDTTPLFSWAHQYYTNRTGGREIGVVLIVQKINTVRKYAKNFQKATYQIS